MIDVDNPKAFVEAQDQAMEPMHCPCCAHDVEICKLNQPLMTMPDKVYWIQCNGCFLTQRNLNTREGAILNWNKRVNYP